MAATAMAGAVAGIGHGHGVVREQGRRGGVRLGRWSSWAREVRVSFIFVFVFFYLFSFCFILVSHCYSLDKIQNLFLI